MTNNLMTLNNNIYYTKFNIPLNHSKSRAGITLNFINNLY